ncbi:MAG: VapC toxin family PIN domain ribonuclease [Rhizobium sp. 63-7]|nr:MAG: VapC toxin family PIN domain ribonuclease [Rhizobium sp. 63-7]
MIVLDTNVVSELVKPRVIPEVAMWMRHHAHTGLYLCDVVVMEQSFGAERFWRQTRSDRYLQILSQLLVSFHGRILGFDHLSALRTGRVRAERQVQGRPISVQDAMIAAICLVNDATLATRNTKDFQGLDLRLVNPFEGG